MKKLLIIILFLLPSSAFAAATYDTSKAGATACGSACTTSLTLTGVVVGASDTLVTVVLSTRIGCTATDVTGVTVALGGTSITSYLVGDANTSIYATGGCTHGRYLYLHNPPTGTLNLVISWTGSAAAAAVIRCYSSAHMGVTSQVNGSGNFSQSITITASDILEGAVANDDTVVTMGQSNATAAADANFVGVGGNTNTGSGSVTVSGLNPAAPDRFVFMATTILSGAPTAYTAPTKTLIFGAQLRGASVH